MHINDTTSNLPSALKPFKQSFLTFPISGKNIWPVKAKESWFKESGNIMKSEEIARIPLIKNLKIIGQRILDSPKCMKKHSQKVIRINYIDLKKTAIKRLERDYNAQLNSRGKQRIKNRYTNYFKKNIQYIETKKITFFCSRRAIRDNTIKKREGLIETSIHQNKANCILNVSI